MQRDLEERAFKQVSFTQCDKKDQIRSINLPEIY